MAISIVSRVGCGLRCAWAGAGAKTVIGYGRFHHDDETTCRWTQRLSVEDRNRREEREQQEAMSSPEAQWGLKLQGLSEADILDLVRIHLEKELAGGSSRTWRIRPGGDIHGPGRGLASGRRT